MSQEKIETKSGKSREVDIYNDYVIKKAINFDIDDEEVLDYIVLALEGEFENLKEIYFWTYIRKYSFLKDGFAEIYNFDFLSQNIKAEKLSEIDPEKWANFFNLYQKFYGQTYSLLNYFDNHTLDNYLNYGIDSNGNLKLLDYALLTTFILNVYDKSIFTIESKYQLYQIKKSLVIDILNNDTIDNSDLYYSLIAFVLTMKYYNNLPKFYYYSYKYKLLSLKDIINNVFTK